MIKIRRDNISHIILGYTTPQQHQPLKRPSYVITLYRNFYTNNLDPTLMDLLNEPQHKITKTRIYNALTTNIQIWRHNMKLLMTTNFLPFLLATILLGLIGCSNEEKSTANNVSDQVTTSAVDANTQLEATMESAEDTMKEVKETVMEDVNKAADETKEVAMKKVEDTKEAATDQVQETVDNANEAADEKVNDVMKGLTDKLGQ